MATSNVFKMIKDNEVEFVDLRFADMLGKQHHVSFPAHSVDESLFEDGKMFDGSSIAGWKGINESDMVLMPDASTAVMDPFAAHKTLLLQCDVLEPSTMQAYARDPRSVARKAEAYLKSTGIADTAFFGPEPEFFIFDGIRYDTNQHESYFFIESSEGAWNSGKEGTNLGYKPRYKEGYFPVSPNDSLNDLRTEMVLEMERV